MMTGDEVREVIAKRKFSKRTGRALVQLASYPELSLRQVARANGLDPGRLCHAASTVPGLREMRSANQNGRAA